MHEAKTVLTEQQEQQALGLLNEQLRQCLEKNKDSGVKIESADAEPSWQYSGQFRCEISISSKPKSQNVFHWLKQDKFIDFHVVDGDNVERTFWRAQDAIDFIKVTLEYTLQVKLVLTVTDEDAIQFLENSQSEERPEKNGTQFTVAEKYKTQSVSQYVEEKLQYLDQEREAAADQRTRKDLEKYQTDSKKFASKLEENRQSNKKTDIINAGIFSNRSSGAYKSVGIGSLGVGSVMGSGVGLSHVTSILVATYAGLGIGATVVIILLFVASRMNQHGKENDAPLFDDLQSEGEEAKELIVHL